MKPLNIKSLVFNFLILNFVIIALYTMTTSKGGVLTSQTADALKYFTVQSNILAGLSALVSIIFILIKKDKPKWLVIVKFVTTNMVFLTFMTCIIYLGPLVGYLVIFSGTNFYMHLVVPLLAIFQFIFDEQKIDFKRSYVFFATIPMIIYGIGYFGNLIAVNGFGDYRYDFYGFGTFGLGIGALVFLMMVALTFGLAFLLYFSYKKAHK